MNKLKKRSKNDIIASLDIDDYIMLNKKKKYLEKHPYAIWQSDDQKYWYTTLPDPSKPRGIKQIRRNSKIELQLTIVDFWESFSDSKPIEDVFIEWNDKRLELKKISPGTHLRNSQIFEKHFCEISEKGIEDFSPEDFADFLEEQIAIHSLTSKAFSNLKGIVKGMLKWARKKKYIDYTADDVLSILDVSERTFKKVIKEDDQEVFDEFEMPKIISYLIENKDIKNLGIILMFVTGLRVGELVALKHSDFNNGTVKIRRTETRVPKGEDGGYDYLIKEFPKSSAGVRTVVLPEEYHWLSDLLSNGKQEDFVFVDTNGKRMTTNVIRRRLERVCKTNSITQKSPHKIRKTYGSILLDNNIDNRLVMNQMGHSDITCTEEHYHRNRRAEEEKTKIISRIPDFQRLKSS